MRALTALLLAAAATPAQAAPCALPDLIDTSPPDEATGIPVDAVLSAHYASIADYLGEEVIFEDKDAGQMRALTGVFDSTQGLLTIRPPEPLAPGAHYVVRWPALRGVTSSALGTSKDVRFTAGQGPDQSAPRFAGLSSLRWDVRREHSDCTDSIEERYRFTLAAGESEDDGGRASLSLVVFQTAGPGITSPRPILTRAMPAAGETVTVELPIDDGVGHVCFAAVARDLADRTSGGGDHEVCVDTVRPPFFLGCSYGRGSGGGGVLAVAALLLLRRRARR
jgi:hypothetical protein